MAWTEITRPQYRREGLRYASSLTDAEWILIEPFMPPVSPIGRPRETDLRKVVDAILYLASTGCQWRQLPKEFPPYSTVQGYFYGWSRDGTFAAINQFLVAAAREQAGRTANPGVIDSQSVKTTESGGPRGFDAAKKVKGRKRHIVTDTAGLLLAAQVHPANVQDSHGAVPLLKSLRRSFPKLRGLSRRPVDPRDRRLRSVIVTRSQSLGTFKAEPRRWVVERTLAWPGRCRRLAKDFETTIASAVAGLLVAHIRTLTRRLARV